jgi:hypothetical protein
MWNGAESESVRDHVHTHTHASTNFAFGCGCSALHTLHTQLDVVAQRTATHMQCECVTDHAHAPTKKRPGARGQLSVCNEQERHARTLPLTRAEVEVNVAVDVRGVHVLRWHVTRLFIHLSARAEARKQASKHRP